MVFSLCFSFMVSSLWFCRYGFSLSSLVMVSRYGFSTAITKRIKEYHKQDTITKKHRRETVNGSHKQKS